MFDLVAFFAALISVMRLATKVTDEVARDTGLKISLPVHISKNKTALSQHCKDNFVLRH